MGKVVPVMLNHYADNRLLLDNDRSGQAHGKSSNLGNAAIVLISISKIIPIAWGEGEWKQLIRVTTDVGEQLRGYASIPAHTKIHSNNPICNIVSYS